MQRGQLQGLGTKSNILPTFQPTVRHRLCSRAMKTIKVRAVDKRCRTPLCFKQASETPMFFLYGINAVSVESIQADVILSSTIHSSQGKRKLRGCVSPHRKEFSWFIMTEKRDLQQGVEAVRLTLSHQHTHTEGFLPALLVVTSSLRLASIVEGVGQHGWLNVLISQAVGGCQCPRCTAQGACLTNPQPVNCLREQ